MGMDLLRNVPQGVLKGVLKGVQKVVIRGSPGQGVNGGRRATRGVSQGSGKGHQGVTGGSLVGQSISFLKTLKLS